MKQVILLIVVLVIFASCSMYQEGDAEKISNMILQTNHDLTYKSDGEFDYWQPAELTRKIKTGDCEDFVILCVDEIKYKLDLNCGMAIINKKDDMSQHAVLYYKGLFFESTNHNRTYINQDKYDIDNPVEIINYCALKYAIKFGYK